MYFINNEMSISYVIGSTITAHLEQGITFELSGYQKDHGPGFRMTLKGIFQLCFGNV